MQMVFQLKKHKLDLSTTGFRSALSTHITWVGSAAAFVLHRNGRTRAIRSSPAATAGTGRAGDPLPRVRTAHWFF